MVIMGSRNVEGDLLGYHDVVFQDRDDVEVEYEPGSVVQRVDKVTPV